ncbi:MAG: hypothetical protein CL946_00725 [Ectothiorhodospiraceae bacterium]|nr:hypothetical protein [Ectothiorhodospiraceae bacterium]
MAKSGELQCPVCGNAIIDEGVDTIVCPRCDTRFDRHAAPSESRRLDGPGIALIITACLGIFGNCLLGMSTLVVPRTAATVQAAGEGAPAAAEADRETRRGAPGVELLAVGIPVFFIYPAVLYAGIQMRQRRNYSVCVAGSVLAMLPCGLACFVGLPCGIWALGTLFDPGVRAAFPGADGNL